MVKYPSEAYKSVMDVYNSIPTNLRNTANTILEKYGKKYPEGEAPPEAMKRDLEQILKENPAEAVPNDISAIHPSTISNARANYALGLISILVTLGALSTGVPYVP